MEASYRVKLSVELGDSSHWTSLEEHTLAVYDDGELAALGSVDASKAAHLFCLAILSQLERGEIRSPSKLFS